MFYGWYIVIAAGLLSFYYGGAVVYGFTSLFNPIAAETGWSYTHLSLASSVRGIEAALLAPLVGALADRWGPRRLIFCGVVMVGLGLFLLSQATSLALFYIAFAVVTLGFAGISPTVMFVSAVNWFRKNLGWALALMTASAGLSGLMVPVLTRLIDAYGWRTVVLFLACGMWALGIPLSLIFRHRPEPYGYLPDGKEGEHPTDKLGNSTNQGEIKAGQALKSRRFWQIASAFALQMMATGALIIHVMPYLDSLGIPRETASLIAMVIPLLSVAARLGFGWLIGLLKAKYLTGIAIGLLAAGLLSFARLGNSRWLFIPFLIAFSAGYGGMFVIRPALIREQFGTKAFGAIYGVTDSVMVLGAILGTPLAGWVFDVRGVYHPIWLIFTGNLLLASLLILTVPPPRTKGRANAVDSFRCKGNSTP